MHIILFVLAASAVANAQFTAIVKMQGEGVSGNITFTQYTTHALVHVTGTILGLKPGKHGLHVHEKGDITGGCISTGVHFNPFGVEHGAPGDSVRHVGDLGNIVSDDNKIAIVNIVDRVISLSGRRGIIGRSLVVHAEADDFGRGGSPLSKTTGNSGARVACGVIGILQ